MATIAPTIKTRYKIILVGEKFIFLELDVDFLDTFSCCNSAIKHTLSKNFVLNKSHRQDDTKQQYRLRCSVPVLVCFIKGIKNAK